MHALEELDVPLHLVHRHRELGPGRHGLKVRRTTLYLPGLVLALMSTRPRILVMRIVQRKRQAKPSAIGMKINTLFTVAT